MTTSSDCSRCNVADFTDFMLLIDCFQVLTCLLPCFLSSLSLTTLWHFIPLPTRQHGLACLTLLFPQGFNSPSHLATYRHKWRGCLGSND